VQAAQAPEQRVVEGLQADADTRESALSQSGGKRGIDIFGVRFQAVLSLHVKFEQRSELLLQRSQGGDAQD